MSVDAKSAAYILGLYNEADELLEEVQRDAPASAQAIFFQARHAALKARTEADVALDRVR